MSYKQMLISMMTIECLQLNKDIINKSINSIKIKKCNNKDKLKTYKHYKQTYNNNNIFFT